MGWREKVFENFRLYGVTDLKRETPDMLWRIERAYQGGADIVQLRSKELSDAALLRLGRKVRKLALRYRKLFFINDRVDLAHALEADGVHLGQDDMPLDMARRLAARAGRRILIGKSTHSLKQAISAVAEGADYIGIGPVFKTPTKQHTKPVGLSFIRQVAAKVRVPWVAIGGIDLANIQSVIEAGATRIAVVRALFAVKDPKMAAKEFKLQLEGK
ncbi:MAG TPA: thiamine phosphate synthase [Candidatus Omnitrophota bacterium]|nr:thiamine phosphate synthase [Candidatus Omnitrophota bacterium]